ncbi:MAG: hypothetical protein WDZ61_00370 [Parcubacteria group bacterium]
MSTGTNFTNGLAVRKPYSGNVDTVNQYHLRANTKLVRKHAVIYCIGSEADNAERTTAFTLPAECIVHDVYINVHTVDATETVDIGTEGTSNDPNGYAALLSLANAGIVRPGVTVTAGSNESYYSAATRGALLATFVAGGDTATDVGTYVEHPHVLKTADPLSFTCSSGTDTAVFDIVVVYDEVVEEE